MRRVAMDTNVILRFLLADVEWQHHAAQQLLRKAESGKIKVVILPVIVAEACFVLNKFYQKSFAEIAEVMESLLAPSWLEIEHRDALRGMWDWYVQGMHFVDSYLLALNKYEGVELVSFDKKMTKKIKA